MGPPNKKKKFFDSSDYYTLQQAVPYLRNERADHDLVLNEKDWIEFKDRMKYDLINLSKIMFKSWSVVSQH